MALGLAASLDADRDAVKLDVTGITGLPATLTIERKAPSGTVAGVRGAVNEPVSTATWMARDYEAPLALQLTYTAKRLSGPGGSVLEQATAAFTVAYTDCDAWLVDIGRPTNSFQATIENMDELEFNVPTGIHRVLDRRAPVVAALPAWTPSLELNVLLDTEDDRDRARYLFGSGYPFLLRTVPALGIGNMYLSLSAFVEERFLTSGYAPERRFRASCVQVQRPDPEVYVPTIPNTYQNVKDSNASYAALEASVANYDQVAYTYPPAGVNPFPPWLPDDA